MSQLMFYENVTPLNREKHRALRLKQTGGDCSFAKEASFVPLAAVEFAQASATYPILFSGSEGDPAPVALLGLAPASNLFVDDKGQWAAGTYVPAFVRRYPFVLARTSSEGDYTVCIDDKYAGFGKKEGEALFDEEGKETGLLKDAIAFLQGFLKEMERTAAFTKRLEELELLIARDMQLTDAQGRNFLLKGFRIIDESRLAGLSDETVLEFHRAGYWPWIYAHLLALGNLSQLQNRVAALA